MRFFFKQLIYESWIRPRNNLSKIAAIMNLRVKKKKEKTPGHSTALEAFPSTERSAAQRLEDFGLEEISSRLQAHAGSRTCQKVSDATLGVVVCSSCPIQNATCDNDM